MATLAPNAPETGSLPEAPAVRLSGIRRVYGDVVAVAGVDLDIGAGEFFTLHGPTIVIGHATFCVVVVYNNVVARLRRSSASLIEASQDLGADGWQTFRFVLWPVLSTALVAGGLLAFALSLTR